MNCGYNHQRMPRTNAFFYSVVANPFLSVAEPIYTVCTVLAARSILRSSQRLCVIAVHIRAFRGAGGLV
jgi:hypothetical protein